MADGMLEIHRPLWQNEDLALICGIANAGGGQLIVGGAEGTRARNVRRMYKVFESIPQLTQETLGFACPAEPIMDGPHLCLEIAVPAATEPILFEGKYYLYTQQGNLCMEGSELEEFLETRAEHAKALAKDDGSISEALDAAGGAAGIWRCAGALFPGSAARRSCFRILRQAFEGGHTFVQDAFRGGSKGPVPDQHGRVRAQGAQRQRASHRAEDCVTAGDKRKHRAKVIPPA